MDFCEIIKKKILHTRNIHHAELIIFRTFILHMFARMHLIYWHLSILLYTKMNQSRGLSTKPPSNKIALYTSSHRYHYQTTPPFPSPGPHYWNCYRQFLYAFYFQKTYTQMKRNSIHILICKISLGIQNLHISWCPHLPWITWMRLVRQFWRFLAISVWNEFFSSHGLAPTTVAPHTTQQELNALWCIIKKRKRHSKNKNKICCRTQWLKLF